MLKSLHQFFSVGEMVVPVGELVVPVGKMVYSLKQRLPFVHQDSLPR